MSFFFTLKMVFCVCRKIWKKYCSRSCANKVSSYSGYHAPLYTVPYHTITLPQYNKPYKPHTIPNLTLLCHTPNKGFFKGENCFSVPSLHFNNLIDNIVFYNFSLANSISTQRCIMPISLIFRKQTPPPFHICILL